MKNSPAFQFYPQDFISDFNVQSMTDGETGKYIKLLCHCWIEDGIPVGSRVVEGWFKQHPTVASCFYEKDGKYRNRRLDEERQKQLNWREKSKVGGLHSAEKKRSFKGGSTKGQPKINQRSTLLSSSSSSLREKNTSFLFLSDLLAERVRVNVPFQEIPTNFRESWANEFRIMVEVKKIDVDRVKAVLDWATTDSFWKINIRSASKFREKFGQLEAKYRSSNGPADAPRSSRVGANNFKPDPREKAERDAAAERIFGEAKPKIDAARESGNGPEAMRIEEEAQRTYEKEAAVIARKYWKSQGEVRP